MKKVRLVEVGPRDGLQNQPKHISTETKVAWINLLSRCGFQSIEVTSFVSPKWVPQMADHADVYRLIEKFPQVHYPVLIPNIKGLEAAITVGVKEIAVFSAASETFSQKNTGCSIDESLARITDVIALARANNIAVRGYVSCIINCPYEGKVRTDQVIKVTQALFDLGCYEVSLGDTTGKATPDEVRVLFKALAKFFDTKKIAGHFHDTDNHTIENIAVAYDEFGITTFDSALTGLGGCPYAPGAKGNVATEKVIAFFQSRAVDTGIDMNALTKAQQFILDALNHV